MDTNTDSVKTKFTELMTTFGITEKYIQKPNDEDKQFPYWSSTHHYDNENPNWGKIRIKIYPFIQSGMKHYFGSIELGIADAVCRVPALADSTDSIEICRRTIQNKVTEQYQRPLDFARIQNINDFYSDNPTIVNPIIIDLPEKSQKNGSAKILIVDDDSSYLEIDLQKIDFISKKQSDYDEGKHIDYRPVDLVDGQHRVRSSKLNKKALKLSTPFVLVNPEFQGGGGRIFAEINVQNQPLDDLHQLHLRYVLSLSSHKENEDYGVYDEDFHENKDLLTDSEYNKFLNRFANRLSYRIGARLNLNPESPIHNLIQFYGKGQLEGRPLRANTWVETCKQWVTQNINLARDEERFIKCIQAFFEAWKRIANTDPFTGDLYEDWERNNRWGYFVNPDTGRENCSKMLSKLWFGQIMKLFPQCYTLGNIKAIENEREMENRFFELLKPCIAIDGTDLQAWKVMKKANSSLKPREDYVYHWMSWAIHDYAQSKTTYEPHEVWNISNTNIKSKPGRGFFSNINADYFKGGLLVENVPIYGNDETGINIFVNAQKMENESQSKIIKLDVYDGNGNIVKSRRKTNVSGNNSTVGDNFYREILPNRNDDLGCTGIEITILSGNLFDYPTREVIFKQRYSIDDLRKIDGERVVLSNVKLDFENTIFEDSFEEMELEGGETFHTIYTENEQLRDQINSIQNQKTGEDGDYDLTYSPPENEGMIEDIDIEKSKRISRSPPKRNTFYQTRPQPKWDPVPYPSDYCIGCRFGYDHSCNYR